MNNWISHNIAYLVKESGLAQDIYGLQFDLKKGVINQYILGKSLPKIETLQKMSKHHKITLDDLINLELSRGNFINTDIPISTVAEPQPGGVYGDKDKIIAAQAETISTLKNHNATLQKLVETLEQKLSQAS